MQGSLQISICTIEDLFAVVVWVFNMICRPVNSFPYRCPSSRESKILTVMIHVVTLSERLKRVLL